MTTLEGWKTNIGSLLIRRLPGNDFDAGRTLATAYLSSIGGWVPDDGGDPTGDGHPTGSPSDQSVVDTIVTQQLDRSRTAIITVPVVIRTSVSGAFASGTSDADVVAALQSDVESRVATALAGSSIQVSSYTWGSRTIDSSRADGILSAAERVAIQSSIAGDDLLDPAARAVSWLRTELSLPTTWMASEVYSRDATPGTPVSVTIIRHTSTSYTTLSSPGYFYVVMIGKRPCMPQSYTRIQE